MRWLPLSPVPCYPTPNKVSAAYYVSSRNGVIYYIIVLKSVFSRRRFPLKSVEIPSLFVPYYGTILRLGNISKLPLLSLLRMVGKNALKYELFVGKIATNYRLSSEGQMNVRIRNRMIISRQEMSS